MSLPPKSPPSDSTNIACIKTCSWSSHQCCQGFMPGTGSDMPWRRIWVGFTPATCRVLAGIGAVCSRSWGCIVEHIHIYLPRPLAGPQACEHGEWGSRLAFTMLNARGSRTSRSTLSHCTAVHRRAATTGAPKLPTSKPATCATALVKPVMYMPAAMACLCVPGTSAGCLHYHLELMEMYRGPAVNVKAQQCDKTAMRMRICRLPDAYSSMIGACLDHCGSNCQEVCEDCTASHIM